MFAALARFHWAAGARVALRANAMVLAIVVFVFGSAPDGLATLRAFLLGVVAPGRMPGSRLLLAAIAAAFAATAVRRVTLGAAGWMRALPIDSRTTWRAGVAALCMAQIAVAIFIPLCTLAVMFVYRAPVSWPRVTALPLLTVAVSATVLPSRRFHTRVISAVGVASAVVGTWPSIVSCVACLAVADATSPQVARSRRRVVRRTLSANRSSALTIWVRMSWRAMRVEGIAGSAALPVVLASYAYFITRNNPGLSPSTAAAVTRVCGALSIAAFASGLANTLLKTRQPWPWARSLPWSSARRVFADAIVIGVPTLIVPIGLTPVNATSALVVCSLVPIGAAAGAFALRRAASRQTGAAGETAIVSLAAGAAVAAWPAASFAALAAAPLLIWLGARRDRNAVATRWVELHHDASGDPAWLSGA